LEYEAYIPLARKTLAAIAAEARQLALRGAFSSPSATADTPTTSTPSAEAQRLLRIVIAHRLGLVPPAETSIVIVVASGHRRESFAACEWVLEAVKKRAEVWKREVYAEGEGRWKENFPAAVGGG
jgi:molybdopterin synthase catalytic subunit